jgi:glycosyltransferase involved in cell wall biosynthesis
VKMLLLSRYGSLGASSRVRYYQYLPFLKSHGFDVKVASLFGDNYISDLYSGKRSISEILHSYITRIGVMLRANRFDLVWLEKEMLPWLPNWFETGIFRCRTPVVVDYDDAVFHRYDQHKFSVVRALLGKKLDAVMRKADLVIAGNDYLGDRARQARARRVEFLPSVVDISRYTIKASSPGRPETIGWIGSPSTTKFLRLVAPALTEMVVLRGIRIVAVGADPEQMKGMPVEVKPWSEETEVADIQEFDIGIMPLPDEPFERGKCGYKLIQYMACGKPVVASPVGVNRVIVRDNIEGLLPVAFSEWGEALGKLCDDPSLRTRFGAAGRKRIEENYSLQTSAPRLEELLRSVIKRDNYEGRPY